MTPMHAPSHPRRSAWRGAALLAALVLGGPSAAAEGDRAQPPARAAEVEGEARATATDAPEPDARRVVVEEGEGAERMFADIQVAPEPAPRSRPAPPGKAPPSAPPSARPPPPGSRPGMPPPPQAPQAPQAAARQVPLEVVPRTQLPPPSSGRAACFQHADALPGLDETNARQLCDAAEGNGPVRCYARAREQALLTDVSALRLCQYADSDAPATCVYEAKLRTFLGEHELVSLCQPTAVLLLGRGVGATVHPLPSGQPLP